MGCKMLLLVLTGQFVQALSDYRPAFPKELAHFVAFSRFSCQQRLYNCNIKRCFSRYRFFNQMQCNIIVINLAQVRTIRSIYIKRIVLFPFSE